MKYTGIIAIVSCVALSVAACGKKDEGQAGDNAAAGGAGGGAECSEKNDVKVTWSGEEMYAPSAFTHEHTMAFLSGMVYNGKTTGKLGYVVLANYEAKLGPYMVEVPKEKGQQVILLQFKTASVATERQTQKTEYAKLKLANGTFEPSWMGKEGGFQVSYFVGGESGGPGISSGDAKGSATLTRSEGALCGTVDFTSPKGSTLKGTFNAPILKDLWAR